MIYKPVYFKLHELVCPHVFYKWGDWVWQFFDPRLLMILDWIREKKGPVSINNWADKKYINSDYIQYIKTRMLAGLPIVKTDIPKSPNGLFDERGMRCNLCDLFWSKTDKGQLYISPHGRWQAADFDIQGMVAEEVRQWLLKDKNKLPYSIRLEKNVGWVHLDVVSSDDKVQLVNP